VSWNKTGEYGSVTVQGLSAQYGYDDNAGVTAKKNVTGYSVGGALKLGAATLQALYTGGNGVARYVPGHNYSGEFLSAVDNQIKVATPQSFTAGWAQAWSDSIRTNLSYGETRIDRDYFDAQNASAVAAAAAWDGNEKIKSAFGNVFWGIAQNTEIGFEYAKGKRTLFSGASGDYERVQMSAHYTF